MIVAVSVLVLALATVIMAATLIRRAGVGLEARVERYEGKRLTLAVQPVTGLVFVMVAIVLTAMEDAWDQLRVAILVLGGAVALTAILQGILTARALPAVATDENAHAEAVVRNALVSIIAIMGLVQFVLAWLAVANP